MDYTLFEELCRTNGTTPAAVTQKLGISKGNASNWKNGGNPSVEVLCKLADELNCTTDSLLGRKSTVKSVTNLGDNNNNIAYCENADIHVISRPDVSEICLAISEIFDHLSLKDRSELILMIYKFYEEHQQKEN